MGNSLTSDQLNRAGEIRSDYYQRFSEYQANAGAYDCNSAWLFAEELDEMPEIENTDYLFGVGSEVDSIVDQAVRDDF